MATATATHLPRHASASSYWSERKAKTKAIAAEYAAKGEAIPYWLQSPAKQRSMDCARIRAHVCDASCGTVCTRFEW